MKRIKCKTVYNMIRQVNTQICNREKRIKEINQNLKCLSPDGGSQIFYLYISLS